MVAVNIPGYSPTVATKKSSAGIIAMGPVSSPAMKVSLRLRWWRMVDQHGGEHPQVVPAKDEEAHKRQDPDDAGQVGEPEGSFGDRPRG